MNKDCRSIFMNDTFLIVVWKQIFLSSSHDIKIDKHDVGTSRVRERQNINSITDVSRHTYMFLCQCYHPKTLILVLTWYYKLCLVFLYITCIL